MPIDPAAVGATSGKVEVSWTSTDTILYALGVGAGADDLAYTTENTKGIEQRVVPTFPVLFGDLAAAVAGLGTIDMSQLVHGEQQVTLLQSLQPHGKATVESRIVGIYDKGKAAVVGIETNGTDGQGSPIFTTYASLFIRGEGGWGGDRGPTSASPDVPDREPDHERIYPTSREQALLYRLSGDRNPLHSDPSFARRAGFERPILHGLCTFGFSARAIVADLCSGNPDGLVHMQGRSAAPVHPGDDLIVRMWRTGDLEATFVTYVAGRGNVIESGLVRFNP